MKVWVFALVSLVVSVIFRIYPYLISGLPFSVDAWPLIRNAELLIANTPVNLESQIFDGYNNYWPMCSVFGATFSLVTGLKPIKAMAIGIPLTGALAVLIFYAFVDKVLQDRKLAFISSIFLATIFPFTILTAGVTKETFTYPLFFLSILLFLGAKSWENVLLFIIVSVTLVAAHHLTAFIFILVLINMVLATLVMKLRKDVSLHKYHLSMILIFVTVTALYVGLYASHGLKISISASDWMSVFSYQVVAFVGVLYFVFIRARKKKNSGTFPKYFSALFGALFIVLLCTRRSIIPQAPVLPVHYVLFSMPFILMVPLAVFGIRLFRRKESEISVLILIWLGSILGVEAYTIFVGSPVGLSLVYRLVNFLCIPLIVLSTAGLQELCRLFAKMRTRRLLNGLLILCTLSIVTLSCYSVFASVSLQERFLGYFWLFTLPEYEACGWSATFSEDTFSADMKVLYLLEGYFDVEVDVIGGLKYFSSKDNVVPESVFVYDQMLQNGFVFYSGQSIMLSEDWMERVDELDIVYSNAAVQIAVGEKD
jgi:uncharacterized membrane protein